MGGEGGFVIGIDEAGRGPVIGPMVIVGYCIKTRKVNQLEEIGVRDSKDLTREQRSQLYRKLVEIADYYISITIPPQLIDIHNLNELEHRMISYIIERASTILQHRLKEAIVDAVGPPRKLKKKLSTRFPLIEITVETNSDRKYSVVSAASIIAKTIRDSIMLSIEEKYGLVGSGYPHDPVTREWIKTYYEKHPQDPPWFIRRSWSTIAILAPKWYKSKPRPRKVQGTQTKTIFDFLRKKRA